MAGKDWGKSFLCEDCVTVFRVYSANGIRKAYCPVCGDNISVHPYKSVQKPENRVVIRWSDRDLSLLAKCESGEMSPYQVAVLTGRTSHSVRMKLKRMNS
ncbi:hypothetical protein PU629_07125 [Pullulanibacillus sp. KACC 23026]|uniref:hypothetical protein n=1 Tax=Pullulanibacillus sp. KACC 23026 TaxID=3028315 RepID=UPI0023AF62E0|nr:hypothetical protein [Pullulanibacillus sp. KACC 23026]WEG14130.1 hypothetical protein PU629_07125 [Pullulanibacillus sp. KACC 23026]